jgi:putative nucleotidyltransferase with HDIG domain
VFEKRDMERLMLASTYAAETLVAAKLSQEIDDTQREVVFTMGAIGESRSKETGNHVKRVAEYSKILALEYGFTEEESELLKQASPMHDIGKIAIPDSILNKPGKLDVEEKAIMDTHTTLGYDMLKFSNKPLVKAAAIVAHEHHEKWDGSGYPYGLQGNDIPIAARIMALADVYDAMIYKRCYKKSYEHDFVKKIITEASGKQFDPIVVESFLRQEQLWITVATRYDDSEKQPDEI